MWFRAILLSAMLAIGVASASPTAAQQTAPVVRPNLMVPTQNRGQQGQDVRPLREVVDQLRSQYGGDLISARLESGARPIYVLRWRMPDGQVRDFRVNAAR